jgi:ABC-type nitrate/sulfonate/bicarbonate transport system permease component
MNVKASRTATRNKVARLLPFLTLCGLVALWELLAAPVVNPIIPAPSAVLSAFARTSHLIVTQDIPLTLLETLIGLAIAIVLGVFIAALLDFLPLVKQALYPLLIVSQTIPIIALAVVLILVFGFDIWPKVIVVVLFCFFPITVSTLDGLSATDPDLVALLRAMGATRQQIWQKVRFPSALPAFFSGLRIAATYSVTGAIVGEYITSQAGLGHYLRSAFSQGKNDQAFAAIVVTAILSIGLVSLVGLVERLALPWFFSQARKQQWQEPGIY